MHVKTNKSGKHTHINFGDICDACWRDSLGKCRQLVWESGDWHSGCAKSCVRTERQGPIGNYLGISQAGCSIIGSLKLAIMSSMDHDDWQMWEVRGFFLFVFFRGLVYEPIMHVFSIMPLTGCWTGLLVNHEMALKHDYLICRIVIILVLVRSVVSGKYFITFCSLHVTV